MSDSRTSAYADAFFAVAAAEGNVSEVEDELFRFARVLEGHDDLRSALTDPHIPAARRQQIVEDLLGGKATTVTTALVSMLVGAGRIGELPRIVEQLASRSSAAGGATIAEVRSAVALTDDQQARLAAAISAKTGHEVTVRNIVDPAVVGGVVTRVGDAVIDGSVRTRLSQLRDAF